jgi:hypothetical protein
MTRAVFAAGAGGARRGDARGALRYRAQSPRRIDPAATLAQRRDPLRASGRDPRVPLPVPFTRCRSRRQSPCDWIAAAFRHSEGTVPKQVATGILALIDRLRPGDGLCHPPRQRNHNGGWSATHRVDVGDPRACCLRPWVVPHRPYRARPGGLRQPAPAARRQCGRAVRVRAASASSRNMGFSFVPRAWAAARVTPPVFASREVRRRPSPAATAANLLKTMCNGEGRLAWSPRLSPMLTARRKRPLRTKQT